MSVRVYMLAKELDLDNQAVMDHLAETGVAVANHMAVLTDDKVKSVRTFFADDDNWEAAKAKVVEKKAAAKKKAVAKKKAAKKKTAKKKTAAKKAAAPKTAPEADELEKASKETVEAAAQQPQAQEPQPEPQPQPQADPEIANPQQADVVETADQEAPPQEEAAAQAKEQKHPKSAPKAKKPKRRGAVKLGTIKLAEPRAKTEPEPVKHGRHKAADRPVIIDEIDDVDTPRSKLSKTNKPARGTKGALPTAKRRIDIIKTSPRQRLASRQRVPFLKDPGSRKKGGRRHKGAHYDEPEVRIEVPDQFEVTLPINAKDLAAKLGVKAGDILGFLLKQGTMARINDSLPPEAIEMVGIEHNKEITVNKPKNIEDVFMDGIVEQRPDHIEKRAPIIAFLGHVDHGKTSLMDKIRSARVVDGESGGITQHIGAYSLNRNGRDLVFLDTPGHEAFTEMRARGANVTDIVVLVVAADDGVMPQTEEAISHAKAAKVAIVVAINKIDKPGANPLKTKQQLAVAGLNPEEWGGDTVCVEVSAITGEGVEDLLEMLVLQADMLELKADPGIPARGTVIEAKVSEDLGVVARLLIIDGTLRRGDAIVAGSTFGKIRALFNDIGKDVPKVGPAMPVSITGLSEVPNAGDKFFVIDDIQRARVVAEQRAHRWREYSLLTRGGAGHVTLENLFNQIDAGKLKELPLIIKADVQGSIEALVKSLNSLSTDEVKINIMHTAVGGITESDVRLADASDAIIIGFHVVPDYKARSLAETRNVDIRIYRIIYEAIDEVKAAMTGMLDPEEKEVLLGSVIVKQTIKISRFGLIAGCQVVSGKIVRSARVRVTRDGVIVYEGSLQSLKRFKDDVKEVGEGFECGIKISGYDDIKEGDVIEAYMIEKVKRELS